LLDECVDWRLSRSIVCHEVKSVGQLGFAVVKNGDLLALADAQFDIFITVDRNLSFQQNIKGVRIAVVVLRGKTNRLADLIPLVPKLLTSIQIANPASS
jgi:hypothetical protein